MKTPGVVSGTEGTPLSGGGWNTVVINKRGGGAGAGVGETVRW